MMNTACYIPPAIIRKVTLEMEGPILTESIYEKVTVETTGHEDSSNLSKILKREKKQ